jgi:hypothetical protein
MKKGKRYQVVYDGRDSEVRFETNPTQVKVHGVWITDWTEVAVSQRDDSGSNTLQKRTEQLIQQGLAKVSVT